MYKYNLPWYLAEQHIYWLHISWKLKLELTQSKTTYIKFHYLTIFKMISYIPIPSIEMSNIKSSFILIYLWTENVRLLKSLKKCF